MTVTQDSLPMVLATVTVTGVERLSPTFVRIELGGPELADFGVDGPLRDQRIKLVFPNAAGRLPSFVGAGESWYAAWMAIPEEERGHMRTYTVRDVRVVDGEQRVVIDFVLHLEPGATGPASRWAGSAQTGDQVVILGPKRGLEFGGIEFLPGQATTIVLAGDETAVPAISGILSGLPADAVGAAFLEVPLATDVLDVRGPAGMTVTWLPRNGLNHGARLIPAVLSHLSPADMSVDVTAEPTDVDPNFWETPTYSSSGEALDDDRSSARVLEGHYIWIAGESGMVTALRRELVSGLGVDRRQVAFMGYWRRGVAMKG